MLKYNGQQLAVGLGSAWTTENAISFPRGRRRDRDDTATKMRLPPDWACPWWHDGQAGRWHGPCPGAGNPVTGSIPAVSRRRMGCTNRIPIGLDAQHATPLVGPTYRTRTRYCLAGLRSAGETLPSRTWDRPAVLRRNPRPEGRKGCQSVAGRTLIRVAADSSTPRQRASGGPESGSSNARASVTAAGRTGRGAPS